MRIRLDSAVALMLLGVVLIACNFTTANIRSLKISDDESGKNEVKSFKPGSKIYAIAEIANNGGKVDAKFRVLYDSVEGQTAGTLVEGAEKTLEVDGSHPAVFWITLPPRGFENGRYKVEVTMLNAGQEKDKKTETFEVSGY